MHNKYLSIRVFKSNTRNRIHYYPDNFELIGVSYDYTE